jgi:hypothetical protein
VNLGPAIAEFEWLRQPERLLARMGQEQREAVEAMLREADARVLYFHGGVFALGSARAGAGSPPPGLTSRGQGALRRISARPRASISRRHRRRSGRLPRHPGDRGGARSDRVRRRVGRRWTGARRAGGSARRRAFAAVGGVAVLALGRPDPVRREHGGKAAVDVTLTPEGLRRRVSDYAGAADPSTGALSPLFAAISSWRLATPCGRACSLRAHLATTGWLTLLGAG